jgi:hypothetical protein
VRTPSTKIDETFASVGAVVGGRNAYEAAEAWGGTDPWGVPSSS